MGGLGASRGRRCQSWVRLGIPTPAAPGILVTHHMIQPLGFPGKSGFPPGWSEKLSNRTLPLKIGFSRPGTPRNRFVLKFCVGWYFQNRFSLEKCLKSTTFDFLVGSWIIGFWLVLISVGTICLSTSVRVQRTRDLRYPPYY